MDENNKKLDDLLLFHEVSKLLTDYWDEVDERTGLNAHEYYVENAVFQKMRSKQEVKAFYDWRRGRGERASFHLINNLKVEQQADGRIIARYIMTLYAGDGAIPLPVKAPASVSAATEVLRREPSGKLKIVSKILKLTFKGDEPTTVMPDAILESMRVRNKGG